MTNQKSAEFTWKNVCAVTDDNVVGKTFAKTERRENLSLSMSSLSSLSVRCPCSCPAGLHDRSRFTEGGSYRGPMSPRCVMSTVDFLSVRKVTKAGNRVIFDEDGSYMQSKETGETTVLKDNGGM